MVFISLGFNCLLAARSWWPIWMSMRNASRSIISRKIFDISSTAALLQSRVENCDHTTSDRCWCLYDTMGRVRCTLHVCSKSAFGRNAFWWICVKGKSFSQSELQRQSVRLASEDGHWWDCAVLIDVFFWYRSMIFSSRTQVLDDIGHNMGEVRGAIFAASFHQLNWPAMPHRSFCSAEFGYHMIHTSVRNPNTYDLDT